jgi:hypothetical protein
MTNSLGIVTVTTCRLEDVQGYLRGPDVIVGVCLDHDMPFQDGVYFATMLREKSYPVAITSMNPDGAENIQRILNEYETRNRYTPCTGRDWEADALAFFGLWER